jgi:hypothetical protein
MHKCINNSIGNIYHLEQFVSEFYPYSQKQLGFNQPATIRFESDEDNAGVMLGKTAYYDPATMEVALYVDGRHPKDVMRSLSHELVHHAQNCRGDFTAQDNTGAGYAQNDPHLRKMEREAYTKGNLIFRDFEDLIKTGKINIEIDFSDSGEPKMSLKEWKNNEINTKLMKKWGFLKESKEVATEDLEERLDPSDPAYQRKKALLDKHAKETGRSRSLYNKEPADGQQAFSFVAAGEEGGEDPVDELEEGCGPEEDELEEGYPGGIRGFGDDVRDAMWMKRKHTDRDGNPRPGGDDAEKYAMMAAAPEDVTAVPTATALEKAQTQAAGDWGQKVRGGRAVPKAAGSDVSAKDRRAGSKSLGTQTWRENKKISVREAKQITRRIIERIKKEGK